jgi:hypothetical protein
MDGDETPRNKPPSAVRKRLIETSAAITADDPESLAFQHSVFCQVGLPYRDPGADARVWRRSQGAAHLEVQAGRAFHRGRDEFVEIGLPWGAKPRLILAHLNGEALRRGSPEVDVGDSLTGFVNRIRGFNGGREIRAFKDQLGRLSAALIRVAFARDGRDFQIETKVVSKFDLWFPKDERQRVLWPSYIRLSLDYFESLMRHAVPLDERALAALAHSAMALDVYVWLAQRLRRVPPGQPQFIPWTALHQQFGVGFRRIRAFREHFRAVLAEVHTQYRGARVSLDDRGMTLRHSLSPVRGRVLSVVPPQTRDKYIQRLP